MKLLIIFLIGFIYPAMSSPVFEWFPGTLQRNVLVTRSYVCHFIFGERIVLALIIL